MRVPSVKIGGVIAIPVVVYPHDRIGNYIH